MPMLLPLMVISAILESEESARVCMVDMTSEERRAIRLGSFGAVPLACKSLAASDAMV